LEQPKSTVFVLGGSNWVEDSAIQLNWLSYASIRMATEMQQSSITLSFFCQTEYRLVSPCKRRTFQDVVCSLIYQLAEQSPSGTEPRAEDLEDALSASEWQSSNCEVSFGSMVHLLIRPLTACDESSIITIVNDRLDQCNWANDQHENADALRMAVGSLIDLVSDPTLSYLNFRILLVMDEGPARHITSRLQSWKGLRFEGLVDWHQEAEDDVDEWVGLEKE
jgi:hypothetical protein